MKEKFGDGMGCTRVF